MEALIAGLFILSVSFTDSGTFGTTTSGDTFSQVQVIDVPRIEVFKLNNETLWYVCDGGVMESLTDLSICISKQ
jgi:hypothetical protein